MSRRRRAANIAACEFRAPPRLILPAKRVSRPPTPFSKQARRRRAALAVLPSEMGSSPFRQRTHYASQRFAMLAQRIFDPRRHLGKNRSRDDALTFKITQLHSEHVPADSSDCSAELIEAARTSQELPQDQHFPFPPKHRQCRVDLRGRLAERGAWLQAGVSVIFSILHHKIHPTCACDAAADISRTYRLQQGAYRCHRP